jgi:hypothetical protein
MNAAINSSDKAILIKSIAQMSHAITSAHYELNGELVASNSSVLLAADAPAGAPSQDSLNDILNKAIEVPSTTSIVTVPSSVTKPGPTPDTTMLQMLTQVRTLESYISTLTAFCIYNEHPAPYDITKADQASAFAVAMAKWRNYVITGGAVKAMAAYLPVTGMVSQSLSKKVTSADLHLEFLTSLFGGFGLPGAAIKQLDSILTGVADQLKQVKLSFETQSSTLDHFLTYYYFATVEGTGGDSGIPAMYDCKVRTMYLHIDQSSWKASLGKSSVEQFSFNMNYYDMDTTMGDVAGDMPAINASIKQLTGKTEKEISALMSPKAITADPQK